MGELQPIRKTILHDHRAKANLVFREIRDFNGEKMGLIMAHYDGTLEDAVEKAKKISNIIFDSFPQASNIQSKMGAYGKDGESRWTINPDFRCVAETEAKNAFLMWEKSL